MPLAQPEQRLLLYALVFFSGFANLATEIIGPRMFASLFGNTTVVWAVMIAVTLVGLAVGYSLGGRVLAHKARLVLIAALIVNAIWLLLVGWIVWELPAGAASGGAAVDISLLLMTASVAFFPPSLLFGLISPIAITWISSGKDAPPGETVGSIYAVGTIGSVGGALAAAFYLIPWVGLTASLQWFAAGLVIFAALLWQDRRRALVAGAAALALVVPQPDFVWREDDGLDLLAQREGYYQTIRVYGDDEIVQMHLGPTFHSRMDRRTGEPTFSYAVTLLALTDADLRGTRVLVIGGAGHALAHALERRGATVTEVEIDPLVVELSDRYFGRINGQVVIQDGRLFIDGSPPDAYDLILVDAFDGAATVPPQLTTREFFLAVDDALAPGGRMLYNFVGTPEGERSRGYRALATTMAAVFDSVGGRSSRGEDGRIAGETSQNILFVAAQGDLSDLPLYLVPTDGVVLTDDHNPMELFLSEGRDFIYYRR